MLLPDDMGGLPTKDPHRIHEERLAQMWSWSWTRRNGKRCHLIYDTPSGSMRFRVDHDNDGKRRRKAELLRISFTTTQEARAFAVATIRRDTQPHGEALSAGRLGRLG